MMMGVGRRNQVGCNILAVMNKTGKLKKTADGRFCDLVLGALDIPNSVGDIYVQKSARDIIAAGGIFHKRLTNGQAKGEYGHPKPWPGVTEDEWLRRTMWTEETRTCHVHTALYIDLIYVDSMKRKVNCFMGDISPTGPYGETLAKQLDNPNDNVAFSVRSITEDVRIRGVRYKEYYALNCFDYVSVGGLEPATKYNTPSMESENIDSITGVPAPVITMDGIRRIIESDAKSNVSTESAAVFKDLLYRAEKAARCKIYVPASSIWK